MYNVNNPYPYGYYPNTPMYYPYPMYNQYPMGQYGYPVNGPVYDPDLSRQRMKLKDYGPDPLIINIKEAAKQNNAFRMALWTGKHLQVTLMTINVGEDIGLEVHPHLDQFIRIEEGQGLVRMGDRKDKLDIEKRAYEDSVIIIPAGKWHNLINTGNRPIKLYSIYAPPQHPRGTVHQTKAIAEAAEKNHSH